MKKLILIMGIICFILFHIEAQTKTANSKFMIRHTVVFKLNYPKGSSEEKEFLSAAAALCSIPGVHNFESLRQTSQKNDFEYGLSMEFDSQKAYDEYTHHPDHTKFVQTYWGKYVDKFLEIDYELIK